MYDPGSSRHRMRAQVAAIDMATPNSTDTQVFVVIRRGVYRQEMMGVFDTERQAREAIENAYHKESDNYHNYELLTVLPNTEILEWAGFTLRPCEPWEIEQVSR